MQKEMRLNLENVPKELKLILELIKAESKEEIERIDPEWFQEIDWQQFIDLCTSSPSLSRITWKSANGR